MKFAHKIIVLVVLSVIVFSLVGCDDPQDTGDFVNTQSELFVEDFGTAFDDSGLDTVAGEIDNLLVGGMTGIDYTD